MSFLPCGARDPSLREANILKTLSHSPHLGKNKKPKIFSQNHERSHFAELHLIETHGGYFNRSDSPRDARWKCCQNQQTNISSHSSVPILSSNLADTLEITFVQLHATALRFVQYAKTATCQCPNANAATLRFVQYAEEPSNMPIFFVQYAEEPSNMPEETICQESSPRSHS